MKKTILGKIHSLETFGTLDGPGLRVVIFFEGCPLRCLYCHNVDMLDMKDYQTFTPRKLLEVVKPFEPYFKAGHGGVTVSGGEPVMQPRFLTEFFRLCKAEKIHTCIDTSLFTTKKVIDELFGVTDLWMVSLKHFDNRTHQWLTGGPNTQILENVKYLSEKIASFVRKHPRSPSKQPKLWIRYLILPGYTDTRFNLKCLEDFCREIRPELIELLPYHTYGVYKWKKLHKPYKLAHLKPPTPKKVQKIKKKLKQAGFEVLLNE